MKTLHPINLVLLVILLFTAIGCGNGAAKEDSKLNRTYITEDYKLSYSWLSPNACEVRYKEVVYTIHTSVGDNTVGELRWNWIGDNSLNIHAGDSSYLLENPYDTGSVSAEEWTKRGIIGVLVFAGLAIFLLRVWC